MLWTEKDVDFSHCGRTVQVALLATFKPMLGYCVVLEPKDMQEYLTELRRVVDKAIEIGNASVKEH